MAGLHLNQLGSLTFDDNSPLLFVYGTLKRGGDRHDLLRSAGARFLGSGTIQGDLYDVDDYPGAFRRPRGAAGSTNQAPARNMIHGEVYRLPNKKALAVLDAYEGIRAGRRGLYRRQLTEVLLEGGKHAQSWTYWLNLVPPGATRVRSWKPLRDRAASSPGLGPAS